MVLHPFTWLLNLAPELLGAIAVAAYSYMSLVPLIQPPVMKLLTTQKEREVVMEQLREVLVLKELHSQSFPLSSFPCYYHPSLPC